MVVESADRVMVTSPGALREVGVGPEKGIVLPNGWDRDDFPKNPPKPAKDSPRVPGRGALYVTQPQPALTGMAQAGWKCGGPCNECREILSAGVDATHVGNLPRESILFTLAFLLVTHNDSPSARASTQERC